MRACRAPGSRGDVVLPDAGRFDGKYGTIAPGGGIVHWTDAHATPFTRSDTNGVLMDGVVTNSGGRQPDPRRHVGDGRLGPPLRVQRHDHPVDLSPYQIAPHGSIV